MAENNLQTPETASETQDKFISNKTYCSLGNDRDGVMEIDLISFVEKGEETRYLSIEVVGFDTPPGTTTPVERISRISISSEIQFNKLKEFISKLQWK